MKNQLLCTFADKRYIINTLRTILETYDILYDKIFIYELKENRNQCICSYNIEDQKYDKFLEDTISVHRKKQSNTFYTINALNQLIIEINNGVLDTNYIIEWDNYKDMVILLNNENLRKQNIKFKEVFYIKGENNAQ